MEINEQAFPLAIAFTFKIFVMQIKTPLLLERQIKIHCKCKMPIYGNRKVNLPVIK